MKKLLFWIIPGGLVAWLAWQYFQYSQLPAATKSNYTGFFDWLNAP